MCEKKQFDIKLAPTSFLPQRRLTTGARRFPRCLNSWIEPGCAHAGMDTEAARSSQLQDLNKFCRIYSFSFFFYLGGGDLNMPEKVLWGKSKVKQQAMLFLEETVAQLETTKI